VVGFILVLQQFATVGKMAGKVRKSHRIVVHIIMLLAPYKTDVYPRQRNFHISLMSWIVVLSAFYKATFPLSPLLSLTFTTIFRCCRHTQCSSISLISWAFRTSTSPSSNLVSPFFLNI
jgi:hypothetical protein